MPGSVIGPLVSNNVIGVIIIAVCDRRSRRDKLAPDRTAAILGAAEIAFDADHHHSALDHRSWCRWRCLARWSIIVGTQGFAPFKALAWFILAVILGLAAAGDVLSDAREVRLVGAADGSDPRHAQCAGDGVHHRQLDRDHAGHLRKSLASTSASRRVREPGRLVGSNFNNDGTALYEAMSALFISQMIGMNLSIKDQVLVVLTSIVASVGAAGIPEAGLVTMTLVFNAVRLAHRLHRAVAAGGLVPGSVSDGD